MTGFDSLGRGILFLSESLTKVSYKRPDKFKYEVISSRQAGGGYGINFPIFINFYVNNVQVFTSLNPRGFVSPISDNAFHFYKFPLRRKFFENDNMIHRIRVTPKRNMSRCLMVICKLWKKTGEFTALTSSPQKLSITTDRYR